MHIYIIEFMTKWLILSADIEVYSRYIVSCTVLPSCCLYSNWRSMWFPRHYCDAIMGTVAYQITSLTIVYTTVYSDADQSKHQSSASLAFVWGIHRGPVNSPHKWPVTRKMFPFDDVIMGNSYIELYDEALMQYSIMESSIEITATLSASEIDQIHGILTDEMLIIFLELLLICLSQCLLFHSSHAMVIDNQGILWRIYYAVVYRFITSWAAGNTSYSMTLLTLSGFLLRWCMSSGWKRSYFSN